MDVAEERVKKYASSAVQCLYTCAGTRKGHKDILVCIKDESIQSDALNALREIGAAFQFPCEETGYKNILHEINEFLIQANIDGSAISVAEIIKKDGVLPHSALLCKNNGVLPYYLSKILAYVFLFEDQSDPAAIMTKEYTDYYGIKESVKKFCQLSNEPELLQIISEQYEKIKAGKHIDDTNKIRLLKKAFSLGFCNEKKYRGCAQCTLLSMFEITGRQHDILFQSASGLAAGMAQSGDGSCGGYTGGIMQMGSVVGRRLDRMKEDGDRAVQLISYGMAQSLRDKFIQTYGSVVCRDIHKEIFGKSFCLRTQAVKKEFDDAGAHETKCTTVIGMACVWVTEILYDKGYIYAIKDVYHLKGFSSDS